MKDPTDLPALLVVLCRVQKSITLRNYPRSFPATSLQRAAGGHAPADGQAWAPAPARGPIGDPICLLFLCALPRTIPSFPLVLELPLLIAHSGTQGQDVCGKLTGVRGRNQKPTTCRVLLRPERALRDAVRCRTSVVTLAARGSRAGCGARLAYARPAT